MNNTIYRHYGNSGFDEQKFVPVKNRPFDRKPLGCFWACPKDSENSWEEYCLSNGYQLEKLEEHFDFQLEETARVLEIKTGYDLRNLPNKYFISNSEVPLICDLKYLLDFEKIATDYDALYVEINGSNSLYWDIYGWDVDTLCIFNPNVIKSIE